MDDGKNRFGGAGGWELGVRIGSDRVEGWDEWTSSIINIFIWVYLNHNSNDILLHHIFHQCF